VHVVTLPARYEVDEAFIVSHSTSVKPAFSVIAEA